MKRSEIVNEITHILDMEAEELCYPFLAELILTTLENKGMLPPEIVQKVYTGHGNHEEIVCYYWEPEEPTVKKLNKITNESSEEYVNRLRNSINKDYGKVISDRINTEIQKSMDGLINQCYDILKEHEEPYGKSIVEEVNAEIKELNRIVDSLKENE